MTMILDRRQFVTALIFSGVPPPHQQEALGTIPLILDRAKSHSQIHTTRK